MKPWISSFETINENERLNGRVMQEVQGCGHKSNTKIMTLPPWINDKWQDEVTLLMSWLVTLHSLLINQLAKQISITLHFPPQTPNKEDQPPSPHFWRKKSLEKEKKIQETKLHSSSPSIILPLGQEQRQWSKTALSPSFLTHILRSIACWKVIEMLYNSSFEASSRKPW